MGSSRYYIDSVCAVVTLIVGLALIPTVVLAPFGILMITSSLMFAVTALQLYQNNESHAVTDGQVKAAYSECYSLTLKRVNGMTEI